MKWIFVFWTLICVGCSQPFDFEIEDQNVLFLDAKVSTEIGKSYIVAYESLEDKRNNVQELEVEVIASTGSSYTFSYNDRLSRYLPTDGNFKGEVGVAYRLEASSGDRAIYRSAFDTIPEPLDFELVIKDSSVLIATDANQVVPRNAKGINVIVKNDAKYARYNSRYTYRHYWTGEYITRENINDYVLFAGNINSLENDEIDIPIDYELRQFWVFLNPLEERPLDPFAPCLDPWCFQSENWDVVFELSQETLSRPTYEFWFQAQQLSNNDGLLFDTFPFPIIGNVSCDNCDQQVLGFFRAVAEETKSEISLL